MNNKSLYFECYSGISGDMTVAALLDLGVNKDYLLNVLKTLPIDGYDINIGRANKNGIDACNFHVILEQEKEEHHHDTHHHHNHTHRNMNDITHIMNQSQLSSTAKTLANKIFHIVAQAESTAHGIPIEEVHFHEVGAIDSIIDIAATAVCIEALGITNIIFSKLCEGTGHVHCQHGMLPVPVPAVVNIVSSHHLSMKITDNQGEMITPTGAAIAAAIKTSDKLPSNYNILKIGQGAGKKDFEKANLLRVYLIEEHNQAKDQIYKLETNLDDCSGEALAFTMEELLKQGAKDVYYTPIIMKKGRPAYELIVLCSHDLIEIMEDLIFTHTTTIGIRRYEVSRTTLPRKVMEVVTPYGLAHVKQVDHNGTLYNYPEFEDVKLLCAASGHSYQEIYALIKELGRQNDR